MANIARAAQERDRPAEAFKLEKFKEDWQRQLVADRALPHPALKVALAISWHMNRKEGGWAWPGISKLADLTGLHRTTVMRAIKWLEDHGYLQVIRGRAGNQRDVNRYLLLLRSAERANTGPAIAREQTVTESDYPSRSNSDYPGCSRSDYPSRTIERLEPPSELLNEPLIQSTPYSATPEAGPSGQVVAFPPTTSKPKRSSRQRGAARAHRLPDDWKPDLDWPQKPPPEGAGLTRLQAEIEAHKFRDHWRAAPGAKGTKLDWDGPWRNWCRRAAEWSDRRGGIGRPSQQSTIEEFERLCGLR